MLQPSSGPATWTDASLDQLLERRWRRLVRGLGPFLRGTWTSFAGFLDLGRVAEDRVFPAARLPLWVAEALARRGQPVPARLALNLSEASVLAFRRIWLAREAMVRGGLEPLLLVALEPVLSARHQALLSSVAGRDRGFWDRFQAAWSASGEALIHEAALRRAGTGYNLEAFQETLHRFQPLTLAPLALVRTSDWPEAGPALVALVERLAAAWQREEDLFQAEDDLAAGTPTWVHRRGGWGATMEALRRDLYLEGGFDALLDQVRGDLAEAEVQARTLDLREAAGWFRARLERLGERQVQGFQEGLARIRPLGSGLQ